jgi:hypothetical protein
MMKKVAAISTILPIGLRDEIRVSTTIFIPGARLMTLDEITRLDDDILAKQPGRITLLKPHH